MILSLFLLLGASLVVYIAGEPPSRKQQVENQLPEKVPPPKEEVFRLVLSWQPGEVALCKGEAEKLWRFDLPSSEYPLKSVSLGDGRRALSPAGIKGKIAVERPSDDLAVKVTGRQNTYVIRLWSTGGQIVQRYPTPPLEDADCIVVDKSENRLYWYPKGEFARSYPVATGRQAAYTPEGRFKVACKLVNPQGPGSELGSRWLGLAVPYDKDPRGGKDPRAPSGRKYGIHGTNDPGSIGHHVTSGCIRLHEEDIKKLYPQVKVDTEVLIRQ